MPHIIRREKMNAPIDVTNIRIETPRLILRAWREADLEDLYEYASVDGVGQMAGWQPHQSIAESEKILRLFIAHKKTLALERKDNEKTIGPIGLEELENLDESYDALRGREIGYTLSKDYWGKGLMPEAVKAVIDYCFSVLDYDFLTCGHFARNSRSRRVIEKCGFHFLKNISFETQMGTGEDGKLYIQYNPEKEVTNV